MRGWAEQVAVQVAANVAAKVQHQSFDNEYQEHRQIGGGIPISRSQLEYFSRILRRFGSVEELLVRADDADEVEG